MGAVAGAAGFGALRLSAAPPYIVGVGRAADPYAATVGAILRSGEWPSARIRGRHVVIKTNLVLQQPAESGGTTHPEVVRALVDFALGSGAARVSIVESAKRGAAWTACGYEFFRTYDAAGRVALVDLSDAPFVLAPVPGGTAYGRVYLAAAAVEPDIVFISAGKLKTHVETGATLTCKNLFGLPPILPYYDPVEAEFRARYKLHDRSVNQAIADLALARPIDFAVIDGSIGMEGDSPDEGTPVVMGLALAGRNAVAVDRVGLAAMQVPQGAVQHLAYATWKGLGPATLAQIEIRGPLFSKAFQRPIIPPLVWLPWAQPSTFAPAAGESTTIVFNLDEVADVRCDVLRVRDQSAIVETIRTVADWSQRPAGTVTLPWDGRDDGGSVVPAGTYAIRVRSRRDPESMFGAAVGWIATV
jgi:uncharacterized protein (DUF362 family)